MISRSRNWAVGAFIAALTVFHITASHGTGKRLGFKGVTLGMSIGEFKELAFPDSGRPPAGGKFVPRAYRVRCEPYMDRIEQCWFEAWKESNPPVCKRDAEEIKRHVWSVNRTMRRFVEKETTVQDIEDRCFARIDVGYGGRPPEFNSDISYNFHGGRLMEIDIYVRPGDVDLLYPKLILAYGRPTVESKPVESNRVGARFRNLVAEWHSDDDSIILKRYNGSSRSGRFTFVHRLTVARYRAVIARASRDAAKDF